MTDTLKTAIKALEALPEDEQENWGTFILGFFKLKQKSAKGANEQVEPYSFLAMLKEASLDLPADYSVTYERALYGREDDLDA